MGLKRSIAAVVLTPVLLLAACSSDEAATPAPAPGPSTPPPAAGAGPDSAGTVTIIDKATIRLQEQVAVLDPAINVAFATSQIRVLTAGQLYRLDRNGQPQPELVESSSTSADGLTVTMTLKPGLLYSDGTPLVANDVVAMYERSILGRPGGSPFFTPFVEGVSAPDDRTVVWKLLRPYANLPLATGLGELSLHPAAAMQREGYFQSPVSAGPYELVGFAPGQQRMRLVANPNYAGGTPVITELEVVVVPDVTQTVLQLISGQLDFAFGMPYTFAAVEEQDDNISIILHPTGGVFQLGLNTTLDGPLGDPVVRQAISLAVDRQQIAERAFLNVTTVNPAWVFSTDPAYEPVLPNNGARDVAAARALLATTPYAGGFTMTIDTFAVRDGHNATLLLLKEQLSEIGIEVIPNPLEIPASLERLNSNTFEAFFQGSVGPSASSVMTVSFCPSGVWGRWMPSGDPRICDLAVQSSGEADPRATLTAAQKLAVERMPQVPLMDRREVVGTRLPVDYFGPVNNTPLLRVETVESLSR